GAEPRHVHDGHRDSGIDRRHAAHRVLHAATVPDRRLDPHGHDHRRHVLHSRLLPADTGGADIITRTPEFDSISLRAQREVVQQPLALIVLALAIAGCSRERPRPDPEPPPYELVEGERLRVREDLVPLLRFERVDESAVAAEIGGLGHVSFAPGAAYAL